MTVVGAGVVGLTCATRLAEAGFAVEVVAAEPTAQTTSAVAGGLWLPYRAEPAERVAAWAAESLRQFLELHRHGEPTVLLRRGRLLYRQRPPRPAWADLVAQAAELCELDAPTAGYGFGYELTVPLVDVPAYLDRLRDRVAAAGGSFVTRRLSALPADGLVVNASGLAARELAGDPTVYSVRGQTLVLDNPGLTQWLCDEDESEDGSLTYVLPRRSDVVVGGTATERDESLEVDPAQQRAMLERAVALVPALRGAAVRAVRVGLRPARPAVRLEAQGGPRGTVVHCYGHGGSGVTLSWGCADEVLALVRGATGRAA